LNYELKVKQFVKLFFGISSELMILKYVNCTIPVFRDIIKLPLAVL